MTVTGDECGWPLKNEDAAEGSTVALPGVLSACGAISARDVVIVAAAVVEASFPTN